MSTTVLDEIVTRLEGLPESSLRVLLDVLKSMPEPANLRRWSPVLGSLSEDEADEMSRIIEEGCENVDPEEW